MKHTISRITTRMTLLSLTLVAAGQEFAQGAFINRPVPYGYSLVANPLNNTAPLGNTVTNLFGPSLNSVHAGNVAISRWTGLGYQTFVYWGNTSSWTDGFNNPVSAVTLEVGEGVLIWNNSMAVTNTFVGDVVGFDFDLLQRLPVSEPPPGVYLRGSIAPLQVSGFADIMGRAPVDLDAVLKLDTAGNPLISYFFDSAWHDPFGGNAIPTVNIGEAAFFDTTGGMFASFTLPDQILVPEPAASSILILGSLGILRFARRK